MSHVRQQIRDQLKTTLTGLTTTGARVYEELGEESANKQFRLLNVMVEVRAKAADNLENTLDTIGAEVEDAIFASGDTTLSGTCKDFDYEGLDIELSGEAEQPFGLMTMRFLAIYRVNKADVETLIA